MLIVLAWFFVAFGTMELTAYLMHRYLMHGPLWFLHESHHRPREGHFEKNDLFGIFFALPSMVLIFFGVLGSPTSLGIGLGMTAYGACYFLLHDVLVHRRLKWRIPKGPMRRYLEGLVTAHHFHHRTIEREGAKSFGFLWAPERYRAKTRSSDAAPDAASASTSVSSSDERAPDRTPALPA